MLIRNNFLAMNQKQEKTSLVKPVQQSNTNQHIAQPANSASSAAVYNHRRADDYDMTKLNDLEKSIVALKDRINKIKTDDSMDMETKNELMQAMNQQLADVQAQLAQERMNQQKDTLMQKEENDKSETKQNNTASDVDKNGQRTNILELDDDLFSAANSLQHLNKQQATTNALENKITNRQEEINHQVNYPRAPEIRLQGQALELKEQEVYQMQDRLLLKEKMQEDLLKKANPVSDSSSNHEDSLRIANQELETDEKDEKAQDNVADEF